MYVAQNDGCGVETMVGDAAHRATLALISGRVLEQQWV